MHKLFIRSVVVLFCLTSEISFSYCQAPPDKAAGIPVNYDEALSGSYTLPDPLVFPDAVILGSEWLLPAVQEKEGQLFQGDGMERQ